MAKRDNRYVPILKSKAGELRACSQLKTSSKAKLRPVLEIMPIEWDFEAETQKSSLADHIDRVTKALVRYVAKDIAAAVDTAPLDADSPGTSTLTAILDKLRSEKAPLAPATDLSRGSAHQNAVRKAAKADGLGVCLRLKSDDFDDLSALANDINQLLGTLQVSPSEVDLVIDLGAIQDNQASILSTALFQWFAAIPHIADWRTFAIAATAFPVNLVGLAANQYHSVQRAEWGMWNALRAKKPVRVPCFGDYGIANPELTELGPRIMQPTASLRYTTDQAWLVYKGKGVRTTGFAQMHAICQSLVKRPEYSGKSFSAGDKWIDECASKKCGPGNLTSYRQVATNHHIEFVLSQLSKLGVI